MFPLINAILVPQGAEYAAVRKGLRRVASSTPPVFALPIGPQPVIAFLQRWQQVGDLAGIAQPTILIMGLCGSLSSRYSVGSAVVYHDCINQGDRRQLDCDPTVTAWVQEVLQRSVHPVTALTSDRLIWSAAEKHQLHTQYQADVVDMEGFAALTHLHQAGMAVTMVRVVSDDCRHDIPDVTAALTPEGDLQSFPLAMAMLRQPLAASRLINGSLRGLRRLQAVTTQLFADLPLTP